MYPAFSSRSSETAASMLGAFCYTHGNYYSEFEGISVAATTFEQVSAVAKRVSDAYGARAATQFLVQIFADGAGMTSNAISQTVALKRWWR